MKKCFNVAFTVECDDEDEVFNALKNFDLSMFYNTSVTFAGLADEDEDE